VVLAAGHDKSPQAARALEELCRTYWYPLYAYVRRRGHGAADAEDITQGFFARLLELESLADVRREKGRFRSFLLAGMNHYLSDVRDRAFAAKRDSRRTISLDSGDAETRYSREPADTMTPERLFEKQWALTLLETVVQQLRGEYEADGKGELFMGLRFAMTGEKSAVPYAELSARLKMTEEALRVAVHRLRRRYRQLLREEIAHTVADESEVAEELRSLRRILSS
jgi:RNA polymerase sigma-70 factor (ECF subfamily)